MHKLGCKVLIILKFLFSRTFNFEHDTCKNLHEFASLCRRSMAADVCVLRLKCFRLSQTWHVSK